MGGGNPIKKIWEAGNDAILKPVSEGLDLVGAEHLAAKTRSLEEKAGALGNTLVDYSSGKLEEQKKKAKDMEAAAMNKYAEDKRRASAAADAAEKDRIESERMAGGSKARTLLTGASGLNEEDENTSYTKRTLAGF